jgi:hypothetical protein
VKIDIKELKKEVKGIIDNLKPNEIFEVENNDNEKIDLIKDMVVEEYGYKQHIILVDSDDKSDDEKYRLIINTKKDNLSIIEDYSSKDDKTVLLFSTKNNKDLAIGVENKIHLKSQFFVMQKLSHLVKKNQVDLETKEVFENKEPFGKFTRKVNEIKYLSIDADDTVFKTSDIYEVFDKDDLKEFAEYTKKLLKVGIKLYINTGRGVMDVVYIIETLEKLGGKIDYAICENGSVFLDYSKIRKESNLSLEKIEKACVWVDGVGETEKEFRDYLLNFLKKEVVNRGLASLEKGKVLGISLNPVKKETSDFKEWLKLFLQKNKQKIIKGLNEESGDLLEAIIHKMNNSTTAVDLNPCRKLGAKYVGINKSDGVDLFCQQMGNIEMEKDDKTWQIVAMGDSTGDLPVFTRCKWNMVPLNGFKLTTEETMEEMKEKHGYEYEIGFVSTYETTKGCNQFFETLIKIKKDK